MAWWQARVKDEEVCVVAGKGYLKDEGRCVAWWQARGI